MGLGERRHGGEVEAREGLAGGQLGLGEVALDAAPGAVGELDLGEGGEQARGGPALLVGAAGEVGPEAGDRGQPELGEHERQPGGVGGKVAGLGHGRISPPSSKPS